MRLSPAELFLAEPGEGAFVPCITSCVAWEGFLVKGNAALLWVKQKVAVFLTWVLLNFDQGEHV